MMKDDVRESPRGVTALLEKIGEQVPYSEGGTRRRLLAGIIVAVTVWSVIGNDPRTLLTTNILNDIFAHPLPSVAMGVAVYLLGTLVEIVGNTSLERAAGEAIRAATAPLESARPAQTVLGVVITANILLLSYSPIWLLQWILDRPWIDVRAIGSSPRSLPAAR
jgi:hypothetical protein